MRKNQLLAAAAASCILLGITSARAADVEPVAEPGWYVSLFGGASFLEDVDTTYDYAGEGVGFGNDAETKLGFILGGAVGTHLTDDIRIELEAAYSENKVDGIEFHDVDGSPSEDFPGVGDFSFLTFMVNAWYDVPLSEDIKPYLGGGAGLAIVNADNVGYENTPDDDPVYDSSEVAFAFQIGAGLRWMAWDGVAFDVGYRLRGIDGPDFEELFPDSTEFDADFIWSHNVIAGISFGL